MKRYTMIFLLVVVSALVGCNGKKAAVVKIPPAKVETKQDGQPGVVVLSKEAEERLGVSTNLPTKGGLRTASSAVLYDTNGTAWVYVRSAPLTYLRVSISLEKIDGSFAILEKPISTDAQIVVAGAAELFGTEAGGGK